MLISYIIKMNDFPEMQNLARWLIAHERCEVNPSEATAKAAVCVCVCEKLRKPLSTLAGVAGYKALVSRALALAKTEVPSLDSLRVGEDGALEAPGPSSRNGTWTKAGEGEVALVTQLLGLLATFIGKALTMQLVRDVWPDAPFEGIGSETEKDHERTRQSEHSQTADRGPGLDEIMGGGLPEYSFNIIAGTPGSGKTTLAHQFVFANATPEHPALYFTVLGEPAMKMLRYQQQYAFFDHAKLNSSIRFINLSQVVLEKDLSAVLDEISREVEAASPGIVVVDSFRTVVRKALAGASEMELQGFVQRLALHLTSWQATTFLLGEYSDGEMRDNPVFTVADGLFWLYQSVERNSIVRKLQIMKLRGQASVPGLHTFRITDAGLQAFPRTLGLTGRKEKEPARKRLSTGIAGVGQDDGRRNPRRGQRPGGRPIGVGEIGPGDPVHRRGHAAGGVGHCGGIRRTSAGVYGAGQEFRPGPGDAAERRQAPYPVPPSPGPLRGRDHAGDTRRGPEDRRQAPGNRFAGRFRDGAGARIPGGLPGIALPDDGSFDGGRGDDFKHGRDDGVLYRVPIQFLLYLVSHRRYYPASLRGDRGPASADPLRRQDAGRQTQPRYPRI